MDSGYLSWVKESDVIGHEIGDATRWPGNFETG